MPISYQSRFSLSSGPLPLLTCGAVPYPHGFSTRLGGVSAGNGLDTLDLGADAGSPEVAENRRRFAAALGASPDRVFSAKQCHSARVETVAESDLGRAFSCDGFVTDRPGLLLTVKIADCVPILLCDPKHAVIAAVHAGWRGTVAGIVFAALNAMTSLGADPAETIAAIGPCIHESCYEVDEPFRTAVAAAPAGAGLLGCLTPIPGKEGRYLADLPAMNRRLLTDAGVAGDRIFATGFCTACAPALFFSHRASGGRRGLMMAGIRLP